MNYLLWIIFRHWHYVWSRFTTTGKQRCTHTHSYSDPGYNHGGVTGTGPYGTGSFAMISSGGYGDDSGTHTHSISVGTIGIPIGSNGAHTHAIIGSTGSQGQGQPPDTTPSYQAVHYIIRT
ncbi:unnamed protein product [Rotaria magnacalcarata]|uniref:Uncharacterized protein n=2 Tax=Rotaria magnacalcarata TaxID=392030 RepID=A0A8S2JPX5_9BILA|nr:unnamed protein product [Rotaria magnacalcarata]CAF3836832.1 unnamed protein product [Rotaria magnacalcarata]